MSVLLKVLQSNATFLQRDKLTVHVDWVKVPGGQDRKGRWFRNIGRTYKDFVGTFRGIISIKNNRY